MPFLFVRCRRLAPLVAAALILAGEALVVAAPPQGTRAAQIVVVRMPDRLQVGEEATAIIELRNLGTDTWPADGSLALGYRWALVSGGQEVDGPRTPLTIPVAPGAATAVCARLAAPAAPGEYRFRWDLIHTETGWFSSSRMSSAPDAEVSVVTRATTSAAQFARLLLFFIVTLGHYILSVVWMRRWLPQESSTDEWMFGGVLAGVASHLFVLHVLAVGAGLSLAPAMATLVVCHAAIAAFTRRSRRAARNSASAASSRGIERLLELASGAAIFMVLARWFQKALVARPLGGVDADHYHGPNAVNFALGVSPLDYTATSHLYPMGTSLLASWFILPLEAPLLADLAVAPAFLLLLTATARLFTFLTGASGIAWTTWLTLALLSTRLMDTASVFSADLMYAAAFLAANTQLFIMARRGLATPADVALASAAIGLLLGSKTTGGLSAALLIAVNAAIALATHRASAWRRPSVRGVAAGVLISSVIVVGAGGIWVIRNWINYGSPIAPSGLTVLGTTIFGGDTVAQMRYHASVMSDVREIDGYNLPARAAHFIREWLGTWWLPSLLLVLIVVVDAAAASRRSGDMVRARSRLAFIIAATALSVVHVALLVQAPWSSLEWTRGLSLRYALPFFVLWPSVAFLALFPLRMQWWSHDVLGALRAFSVPAGGVRLAAVAVAAVGAAAWLLSSATAAAHRIVLDDAHRTEVGLRGCEAPKGMKDPDHVRVYLAALDYEEKAGACEARRFFVAARFDAPMVLQPVPYRNVVLDARPRTLVTRTLASDGPGTRPCDYIIAAEDELATTRGTPIVKRLEAEDALRTVGTIGTYRLYAVAFRGIARKR